MELRYHHAIPGWCKVIGLKIRPVPECEGGGFMVREDQAELIVRHDALFTEQRNEIADLKLQLVQRQQYIEEMAGLRGSVMQEDDSSQGRASAQPGQTTE